MKYPHITNIFLILFALALSGCHQHDEEGGHSHDNAFGHSHGEGETHADHADHSDEDPAGVRLTKAQMESIDLQVGPVEYRNLTSSIKANGFLKVPNHKKATVTSMYEGVIRQLNIMPGSSVSKGQTIATVTNPAYIEVQEEYLSLKPRIELAAATVSRQEELTSGNAGALKNLQSARAELESLRIRRSSLHKQLRLMGIDPDKLSGDNLVSELAVRTPLGGSVGEVFINKGAAVGPSTPIASVVDNSQLHLDLHVYEKDLPYVRKGQRIQFILTNQPGKSYTAEVFSIGTTFENESKSIAVHSVVKGDKEGLIEGMSVTAQLNVNDAKVPALPTEAIVNDEGVYSVFMLQAPAGTDPLQPMAVNLEQEETEFIKIPIKKGDSEMGYSEITLLEKAPENALFVTKGAFFLLAKMTNSGEAHSH